MKVSELITELEALDQDAEVAFDDGEDDDGCDITGVEVDINNGVVFLLSEDDDDEETEISGIAADDDAN